MDLDYLREHPEKLPFFLKHQRIRSTPVSGGDTSAPQRLTLDDGPDLFAKFAEDIPAGVLRAEARSLAWLAAAGAPTPRVLLDAEEVLALEWIEPGDPDPAAAELLGRALAHTHRAGAAGYGADWKGHIGRLELDNTLEQGPWAEWFAERRLLPYLRSSRDDGALDAADAAALERLCERLGEYAGAEEPPARLHGDLWPGNLLWGADGKARLVDPAAHGGHRETDLATLRLWGGAPHLDRILAAYAEVHPPSAGWEERTGLHQLHLLAVHTALFGRSFRSQLLEAASPWL